MKETVEPLLGDVVCGPPDLVTASDYGLKLYNVIQASRSRDPGPGWARRPAARVRSPLTSSPRWRPYTQTVHKFTGQSGRRGDSVHCLER